MGWIAPLLFSPGLRWWLGQCLPFALKSGESLRRAAMVAVRHVRAARVRRCLGPSARLDLASGCSWPALALRPPQRARHPRPGSRLLFRGLALSCSRWAPGGWPRSSADAGPPTTATLARIDTRMDLAAAEGGWPRWPRPPTRRSTSRRSTGPTISAAPVPRLSGPAAPRQAGADFQIARYLEPHWVDLCLNEGRSGSPRTRPTRCLDAWREALRRAGPKATRLTARCLDLSQDNPEVHARPAQIRRDAIPTT